MASPSFDRDVFITDERNFTLSTGSWSAPPACMSSIQTLRTLENFLPFDRSNQPGATKGRSPGTLWLARLCPNVATVTNTLVPGHSSQGGSALSSMSQPRRDLPTEGRGL